MITIVMAIFISFSAGYVIGYQQDTSDVRTTQVMERTEGGRRGTP